jgi:hypothetical protein
VLKKPQEATFLPSSVTDSHEIWEPEPPGTLRACPDLFADCFTFTFYLLHGGYEERRNFIVSVEYVRTLDLRNTK